MQDEVIASIIGTAVDDMVVMADGAVRRSGVMLRFETIRAEINQVRHTPLEAYREQDRVHVLWQQMITLLLQTQQDHIWQTQPYRFNDRQKEAFERLVSAARQTACRFAIES